MSTEIFPLLTKSTYLNTAYVGPMSKSLAAFRRKHEADYVQNGGEYKINAYKAIEETHETLANFFGSSPDNTFVVPNFSIGIRTAISLLPKKLNILMFTEEYPSLVKAFEERDFHVHKIKMQPFIEQAIEKRLALGDIDVLALSIVQFASGLLIDIKFLKKIKNQYPNLILVGDGTQFLGGHNFNFDSSPFDIVAASGYKWLLAGFGNGVMMISEAYLNLIQKKSIALFNLIFNGHFNILATASLKFAIEAFENNNFGLLMKKKEDLTQHARKLLNEYNLIDPWVSQRVQHSGIFIIKAEKDLHKKLIKNNIRCVPRGEGVRVSFHYYNTNKDLDRLLNVIKN